MLFKDMKDGTKVRIVEGGFLCMQDTWGNTTTIQQDETGNLWLPCMLGRHYLYEDLADETGDIPELEEVKE